MSSNKAKDLLTFTNQEFGFLDLYEQSSKAEFEEIVRKDKNNEPLNELEKMKLKQMKDKDGNYYYFEDKKLSDENLNKMMFVPEDKRDSTVGVDEEMVREASETIKEKEVEFLSFANKQLNLLSAAMLKCSIECYSGGNSVGEAGKCAQLCFDDGLKGSTFIHSLLEQKREDLEICLERAKDMKHNHNPVQSYIDCYSKMADSFTQTKKIVAGEMSYYI